MSRLKIAVVSGGYSGEYIVSINTGKNIFTHLSSLNIYDLYQIVIDRNSWSYINSKGEKQEVNKNDFSIIEGENKIVFDSVFLCIHGSPGEDGKIQGYFDMLGISYAMSDLISTAITFNKKVCNEYLRPLGLVNIANSMLVKKTEKIHIDHILSELTLPLFVKPNEGGSSLATFKIKEKSELISAIQKAFEVDDSVILEEFIEGREFSIGVFEDGDKTIALPITELISKKEFFDFEAKYQPGMTNEITPADIPNVVKERMQKATVDIFKAVGCSYFSRIDFIWNPNTDKIYFLEVNTMPGQSDASILPQQIRNFGMTMPEFYNKMIVKSLNKS